MMEMEGSTEVQQIPQQDNSASDQMIDQNAEHDMGMDEDDYYYEGEDYRHYTPRGRGGFRYTYMYLTIF